MAQITDLLDESKIVNEDQESTEQSTNNDLINFSKHNNIMMIAAGVANKESNCKHNRAQYFDIVKLSKEQRKCSIYSNLHTTNITIQDQEKLVDTTKDIGS